eukprot:1026703-Pyramimonas_sp.AAC.1
MLLAIAQNERMSRANGPRTMVRTRSARCWKDVEHCRKKLCQCHIRPLSAENARGKACANVLVEDLMQ